MATLYGDLMAAQTDDEFYEVIAQRRITLEDVMENLYGDGKGLCADCRLCIKREPSYYKKLVLLRKILRKNKHKHIQTRSNSLPIGSRLSQPSSANAKKTSTVATASTAVAFL